MLKNISSLGKTLNKEQQQSINGGSYSLNDPDCELTIVCTDEGDCYEVDECEDEG